MASNQGVGGSTPSGRTEIYPKESVIIHCMIDANPDEMIAPVADFLVDDMNADSPTPLKEFLETQKLDYSMESLKAVDSYLEKVRVNKSDRVAFIKLHILLNK